MAKSLLTIGLCLLLSNTVSCKNKGAAKTTKPESKKTMPTKTAKYAKGEAGARALLTALQKGSAEERHTLSLALKPTLDDYKAIFASVDVAKKAQDGYQRLWGKIESKQWPGIGPSRSEQTALLVWAASSEDLQQKKGNASHFPGGWRHVADKLKPGLTFYRFKFVKPGETLGMAFDGLVHVNGRWVIIPKPWRAAR